MARYNSRTERVTVRFPPDLLEILRERARSNCRSVSAEVRELLVFARNSIVGGSAKISEWRNAPSTSICLTPGMKNWLCSRARYVDRTIQSELISLLTYSVETIMERDLAMLEEWTQSDPATVEPGRI